MSYSPLGVSGDPFSVAAAPPSQQCQICRGRIEGTDAFCRTCGAPGPAPTRFDRAAWVAPVQPSRAASTQLSSFRAQGGLLAVAALLIGAGCKFPWISFDGLPFMQFGLAPPLNEIWPVAAGAALLGVLGLSAVANADRVSGGMWLMSLMVTVGIGAVMFPKYREITQSIVDSEPGMGVAHGLGLWLIAGGIIAGLIASAAGWSAASRRQR